MKPEDLYHHVANFWPAESKNCDEKYKKQVLGLVQERLKYFSELPDLTRFFFVDLPVNKSLIENHKQLKKLSPANLVELLKAASKKLSGSDFSAQDLSKKLNELIEETGQKPAVLFSIIRIATTWSPASPGLAETMCVLGKEKSLARIKSAVIELSGK